MFFFSVIGAIQMRYDDDDDIECPSFNVLRYYVTSLLLTERMTRVTVYMSTVWHKMLWSESGKEGGGTMHVREFSPMKESRRTCVSLLALNGKWAPRRPSARIHSCTSCHQHTTRATCSAWSGHAQPTYRYWIGRYTIWFDISILNWYIDMTTYQSITIHGWGCLHCMAQRTEACLGSPSRYPFCTCSTSLWSVAFENWAGEPVCWICC